MKRSLKIVLSLIMVALMAYNMIGYIFVFELSDVFNREKMERLLSNMDDSKLQLIKVSDISQVIRKGNHEIIFDGRHYDVKKEVALNGSIVFYCIHDREEENLYAGFNNSIIVNSDVQTGKQDVHLFSALKNFAKDFFFQHAIDPVPVITIVQNAFADNESFSSTVFSSVITPPPKAPVA